MVLELNKGAFCAAGTSADGRECAWSMALSGNGDVASATIRRGRRVMAWALPTRCLSNLFQSRRRSTPRNDRHGALSDGVGPSLCRPGFPVLLPHLHQVLIVEIYVATKIQPFDGGNDGKAVL